MRRFQYSPKALIAALAIIVCLGAHAGGFASGMASSNDGYNQGIEDNDRRLQRKLQNQLLEQQMERQRLENEETLRRKAAQLNQQQAQQEQEARLNQFWYVVSLQIPNYREVYGDTGFQLWLNSKDPMTDIFRLTYMDDAINKGEPSRGVAIIREWQTGKVIFPGNKIIAVDESRFFNELDRLQPAWRKINQDPNFLAWLGSIDPKTGITYQAYLDDARKNLDVSRVQSIFLGFLVFSPNVPDYLKAKPNNPSHKTQQQRLTM